MNWNNWETDWTRDKQGFKVFNCPSGKHLSSVYWLYGYYCAKCHVNMVTGKKRPKGLVLG